MRCKRSSNKRNNLTRNLNSFWKWYLWEACQTFCVREAQQLSVDKLRRLSFTQCLVQLTPTVLHDNIVKCNYNNSSELEVAGTRLSQLTHTKKLSWLGKEKETTEKWAEGDEDKKICELQERLQGTREQRKINEGSARITRFGLVSRPPRACGEQCV